MADIGTIGGSGASGILAALGVLYAKYIAIDKKQDETIKEQGVSIKTLQDTSITNKDCDKCNHSLVATVEAKHTLVMSEIGHVKEGLIGLESRTVEGLKDVNKSISGLSNLILQANQERK